MQTPTPLTPSDLDLTQFQFDNLHKLLTYAKAYPDTPFDIRAWVTYPDGDQEYYNYVVKSTYPCGTSCCLAGMGVFAGILPIPDEAWHNYINRVFCRPESPIYYYLFCQAHLNSLPHAIARLSDFLTNGLPQDVNLSTHEVL